MAAELVGGAFLSGFANVLLDRLSSPELVNLIQGKKLGPKLLQRLESTLYAVQVVLNDAEQKHIKDPYVKKWLDDLKDALYVADDLLDEVTTKAATQKEVTSFFSRYFSSQEREMVNKMEEITERLEYILKLKDSLGLKEFAMENFSWRNPSSSIEDGANIYGRDNDKEAILRLLLDDDASKSDDKISVIPIVGMGGIGKTTLAQLVYNDENLKHKFDFQAWVCVSQEFDIERVTKTITEAVTGRPCLLIDMDSVHLGLKDKLTGKKFFVVLDDVWIENYRNWNFLKKPFQYGARGSKILVTTRSERVISVVQTFPAYHLNQLSNEHCWLVFANHACLSLEPNEEALKEIGKEIIEKCKGLPLAAQSLGGMLRTKRNIIDWNNVLNSEIWEFSENESEIIPALRISYHYLPSCLKRCFVYCSLYPKDHHFDKKELILLWMAEDLLLITKEGKTLEEVGYEYFDDLTSRSFFRPSSIGSGYFVMHDLMHDLATFLGGKFYSRLKEVGMETKINVKTRHLAISMSSDPVLKIFEVFERVKFLRTFLPFFYAPSNHEMTLSVILSKLKYLRVLSLCSFRDIDVLPDSIGELIHLRYLDLSWTKIKALPDSLSNSYNLQTLKLNYCRHLTMLPSCIHDLINLRHLCLHGTYIKEMPRGMGKLKHLQHLNYFIVGEHEENRIMVLGELSNLKGSLWIKKLENVTNSSEALAARTMDKKHIESLTLEWSCGDEVNDSQTEMDILHNLQPHHHLKQLCLDGYRGTRFPDWVGNCSYSNMTKLTISNCENCCMLPSLGQLPTLEILRIEGLKKVMIIDAVFYKNDESSSVTPFPSLESLEFDNMPCWEEWHLFESDVFPQLECLSINNCPRLKGDLPHHLPALQFLWMVDCEQLDCSLPRAPATHTLRIVNCSFAASFPRDSLPASLNTLRIRNCKFESFPEGVMLPNLRMINIATNCEKQLGGLASMHMLTHVSIKGPLESVESFPKEGLLPPSLTYLKLWKLSSLETLECKGLLHLISLQKLTVQDCPKLHNIAGERLPPSLLELEIDGCLLLQEQCHKKDPRIWPKISHIPNFQVR